MAYTIETTRILREEVAIPGNVVVFEQHGSYFGKTFVPNGYYWHLKDKSRFGGTPTVKKLSYDTFKREILQNRDWYGKMFIL